MDRNTLELICVIGMGVFLLLWVIGCMILLILDVEKSYRDTPFLYHVSCSRCQLKFDAKGKDLRGIFYKQKSKTRTKIKHGAFVNAPKYQYYARKIYCPDCQKVRWCQVDNIEDARANNIGNSMKLVIKMFIRMFVGGMIILLLFQIPLGIFHLALSILFDLW